MKKTITRRQAIAMFQQLGQMALGHLNDADIEKAMDNIAELLKVAEQYSKLSEEKGTLRLEYQIDMNGGYAATQTIQVDYTAEKPC